jgi:hypothetical protein
VQRLRQKRLNVGLRVELLIGDECSWQDIKSDKFGKYSFTMRPLWSNL